MESLYQPVEPYATHKLKVDEIHTLYVEESGNKKGIPVLFLHGGPGGGCVPTHRRFFDPNKYRIILFDQRGAGNSTPHACLENNTSQDLIDDIEKIRLKLDIESWVVFGGSWGSTLALLYAIAHKERVKHLVLRGIFLCREHELKWFYQKGASRIFPDHWQDYISVLPDPDVDDYIKTYYKLLTHDDDKIRENAAYQWSLWEARCATLLPDKDVEDMFSNNHTSLSLARIECHYFINNIFYPPNFILDNLAKIADIPTEIVHGRYDVICPVENAFDLAEGLNNVNLEVIPDAGHAYSELGIAKALVSIMDRLVSMY